MDLGTGDGRAVLARAAGDPLTLVVGVDANASGMADASRRARRAHLSNVVFVAADALALRAGLWGLADELTITLPWGSLLHAAVAADVRLTRLLRAGGRLALLVSAAAADRASGLVDLDPARMTDAYRAAGLDMRVRPATLADVRAAGSSWGKRLLQGGRGGHDRRLWLFEATVPLSQAPEPRARRRPPPPMRAATGRSSLTRRAR